MPLGQNIVKWTSCVMLGACTGCASCLTVVPPDIAITGEKTAIERQIVGEYRELEKDAWVISTVKTPVYGVRASSAGETGDGELMAALRLREYHDGKIRKYKDEGVLGETSTGLASYREAARYERDPEEKKKLLAVIEEENRARRIIFTRSAAQTGIEPVEEDILRAGRSFAMEQARTARRGDWLQNRNGAWSRKK